MSDIATVKNGEFTATDAHALAVELFREGRLDEAREAVGPDRSLDAVLLLTKIEGKARNYEAALALLEAHSDRFATSDSRTRARFHVSRAAVYRDMAAHNPAYLDRALLEYEAAIFHQLRVESFHDAGCAENNLALVLAQIGRSDEARAHLTRARDHFRRLPVKLAEVDDTEAQICLLEGKPGEALTLALRACQTFDGHFEKRLLDESLPTLQKAIADYRAARPKRKAAADVMPATV